MAKFYEVKKTPISYQGLIRKGIQDPQLTEKERLGNNKCDEGGEHEWLLYPEWSEMVKQGGKRYMLCLKCYESSHL